MTKLQALMMVAIGVLLSGCQDTATPSGKQEVVGHNLPTDTVKLEIDFGDSGREKVTFRQAFVEGSTVIDVLLNAAKANDLKVDYTGQGETAFIKGIDGVIGGQDGREWWVFTVNGKMAQQGAGVVKMKLNDKIRWSLGKYEPE